jgi:anti-sigma regulatory factor (Ser/Thr protein kinase)
VAGLGVDVQEPGAHSGTGLHAAFLYHRVAEYAAVVNEFLQAGLCVGVPTFVAVPEAHYQLLGQAQHGSLLTMINMEELGRNPARIISALREFADKYPGQQIRYLGEPLWPGRSEPERQEVARHEALLNLAFADSMLTIMCPYDAAEMSATALAQVQASHPTVLSDRSSQTSLRYAGPNGHPAFLDERLPAPPVEAIELAYDHDLRPVRAFVAAAAKLAGLGPERGTDLVIAASEIAANTLRHTNGGGVVRIWHTPAEVLCQVEDGGFIVDPLAGHFRPADEQSGGQGLWLVNQVCDLVQIRTSNQGTTIRVHIRRR